MEPNQDIVRLGEVIHDALVDFVDQHPNMLEVYPLSLEGGCAIAAAFLTRAVRNRLGLKARFAANTGHSWVECEGFIYDPTAKQFSMTYPKVKVIDLKDIDEDDPYPYGRVETCRISHINKTWPRGQQPQRLRLDWKPDGTASFRPAKKRKKAA